METEPTKLCTKEVVGWLIGSIRKSVVMFIELPAVVVAPHSRRPILPLTRAAGSGAAS